MYLLILINKFDLILDSSFYFFLSIKSETLLRDVNKLSCYRNQIKRNIVTTRLRQIEERHKRGFILYLFNDEISNLLNVSKLFIIELFIKLRHY